MGMDKCKEILLERGNIFLEKANLARKKIAKIACPFIPTGSKILTHSM
jgi:translation initiation factor 2B subunit (eIF-2B alpha/beta/delta family)